ncbi:MAG: diaminobutyrate--2-oxoglutarate transaminase, partial [Mesorhizobium sp.]
LETAGSYGEVLKFMPALTIAEADLRRGLSIIRDCVRTAQDSTAASR